jgi:hypothetical protein
VRGSTVDGVMGWPAGGPSRNGLVRGTGGGAVTGGIGVENTPGEVEGNPLRGSVCTSLPLGKPVRESSGNWLVGRPVRGSTVDGTPTGGVGVSVGELKGGVVERGPGSGVVVLLWASAATAVNRTTPSASVRVRRYIMTSSCSA